MDATENGAKQARSINPGLFEKLTREEYRKLGYVKAKQTYKTEAKQEEFMIGWIAVMQPYFKMMADGPRRRVTHALITIECDRCLSQEMLEFTGDDISDFVRIYKNKPCPECQKADRCIDDEFDTNDLERV